MLSGFFNSYRHDLQPAVLHLTRSSRIPNHRHGNMALFLKPSHFQVLDQRCIIRHISRSMWSAGKPTEMPPAPPPPTPPPLPRPPMPPRPATKVNNFIFQKFLDFVQGYQSLMEKRFPQAMHVYRVFIVGFKDFSKELADYVKIKTKALLSSNGVFKLSRHDLDVYYRMPSEIFRVGPTLLLSALPGFQYIIFPIA